MQLISTTTIDSKRLICNCIILTTYNVQFRWHRETVSESRACFRRVGKQSTSINIHRSPRKNRDNGFSILVLPLERQRRNAGMLVEQRAKSLHPPPAKNSMSRPNFPLYLANPFISYHIFIPDYYCKRRF